MTVTNLDYLAAKYAQDVIAQTQGVDKSTVENAITKVLGVLQEQGVYACFVFALSRARSANNESQSMQAIVSEMAKLLQELDFAVTYEKDAEATLKQVAEHITKDLERLLLAKDVLEQMLIYARYGAKARKDMVQDTPTENQQQGA
ncbi:MAG: hypothetical protein CV045_12185 [Cyanobacteria bacterium M5B4]|nr:MAG: hypothetical protein CV045_12185 [Cyanobacteria bacterium M5B4]